MPVIEAQCASILVPHDHRHINQGRELPVRLPRALGPAHLDATHYCALQHAAALLRADIPGPRARTTKGRGSTSVPLAWSLNSGRVPPGGPWVIMGLGGLMQLATSAHGHD
jgi:hypothetical protein